MDSTRWHNLSRARRAFENRAETAGDGPLEAFFEVSARCNLRCVMCAINVDRRYRPSAGRPGLLEPELFERLRPGFGHLIRAYLFGLGEPLLNPHLADYARALGAAGAEVWFNSNGTLIDDAAADELARAGVDAITISMDGATAATYESIRRGASFAAVLGALRALTAARRRHGRPAVDLSFVAMAGNLGELPELVELCAREGVGSIHVEPLFAQQRDELGGLYAEQNLGALGADRVSAIFAEAARRGRELGVGLGSRFLAESGDPDYVRRATERPASWRCSEPWTSVWVTAAGEVRCCCLNDSSFGSLAGGTLAEIWNGDAFRAFRRAHAHGSLPASCANCRRNGRARLSPWFAAVEPVTYRPLRDDDAPSAPAGGPVLDWPGPDDVVTDPLVLVGRLPRRLRARERQLEVLVDRTVVADLAVGGVVDGREFAISIPVPYLTEGAHLLWLRPRGSAGHPGWGHRPVHVWRPQRGAGVLASGAVALPVARSRWRGRPRVLVDGAPAGFRWLRGGRCHRRACFVLLDAAPLPPGDHVVRIEAAGLPPLELPLRRLARAEADPAEPPGCGSEISAGPRGTPSPGSAM